MVQATDELVILLPPSEGKSQGGRRGPQASTFGRPLAPSRRAIRSAIGTLVATTHPATLAKVFGVRGELLDRALIDMASLASGRAPVMPAWQRYTGVVWEHLDPHSLTTSQRGRIIVPSGVYGVTTAEDLIADYRLKMTARLEGIGQLGSFWRTPVTRAITRFGSGLVVDLLPSEHRAAVDLAALAAVRPVVSIRFRAADGVGAVGRAAKSVKGRIASILLRHGLDGLEGMQSEGWRVSRSIDGFEVTALA